MREQAKLPLSAQHAAPLPQSVSRIIQKIKRKNLPPEPISLDDIELRDEDKLTEDGYSFLMYDSQEDDE